MWISQAIFLLLCWWGFGHCWYSPASIFIRESQQTIPTRDYRVVIPEGQSLIENDCQMHRLQQETEFGQFSHRKLQQTAPDFVDYNGAFESVILTDDRQIVENTALYPYSTVVHIDIQCPSYPDESSRCSGTMVGPRTVLTAGHCIKNYLKGTDKGEVCGNFTVTPGKQGAVEPYGSTGVERAIVSPNWDNADTNRNYSRSDYGLLILEEPLGVQTGYMSISLDCFQTDYPDVIVAGYPADNPYDGDTMVSSKCSVELNACKNNISDGEFAHQCDTFGGQSGAGMWVIIDNKRELRGVHVRGTRDTVDGSNTAVYISVDSFLWMQQYIV